MSGPKLWKDHGNFDVAKNGEAKQELQKPDITNALADIVLEGAWERAAGCERQQASSKDWCDPTSPSMEGWIDNGYLSTKPQQQSFNA
jgi:hypothetical protein